MQQFDVEFLGSTCNGVFGSCVQSEFTFRNADEATLAAQALLDQVFLDSSLGMFDSDPSKTAGCVSMFSCTALTAYDATPTSVFVGSASNVRPGAQLPDVVELGLLEQNGPQFTEPALVQVTTFARWTATDVPDSSTFPLIAMSLVFLGWARRRFESGYRV